MRENRDKCSAPFIGVSRHRIVTDGSLPQSGMRDKSESLMILMKGQELVT